MICVCAASTVEKSAGLPCGWKKQSTTPRPAFARQIQWQAFGAEGVSHWRSTSSGLRIPAVDLVDDDEAAEPAIVREVHQPLGDRVHAGRGADHHSGGFHGLEHGERAAEEIGITRAYRSA